jgi:hypothetical protein
LEEAGGVVDSAVGVVVDVEEVEEGDSAVEAALEEKVLEEEEAMAAGAPALLLPPGVLHKMVQEAAAAGPDGAAAAPSSNEEAEAAPEVAAPVASEGGWGMPPANSPANPRPPLGPSGAADTGRSWGVPGVTAVEQPVGRWLDKSGRGNHLIQPTSASRPTYSKRYNVLLATATLATQSVTVAAGSYTLSFAGAGSITLSGTGSGTFSAGTHTITTTAGSLTLTVSGAVTTADFRRTIHTQMGMPAYQRVTTATDYDETGFLPRLRFDGADDSLYSAASVNFSASDEMTVLAGLTRRISELG